jgi:lipopolysaccharide/colanic/teichoic acid biosynthesis glycosyltransferase
MLADGIAVSDAQSARSEDNVLSPATVDVAAASGKAETRIEEKVSCGATGEFSALAATVADVRLPQIDGPDRSSSEEVPAPQSPSSDEIPARAGRIVQRVLSRSYGIAKVIVDFSLAVALAILAAPVTLLTALAVKLTSRGPAFYSQIRLGRGGRPYAIFKIRTMTHNCEKSSGACWSTAGDSRITPIGRFLRRSHIDELPQLWNVLRGDMSLVGPRPERPEFVPKLAQAIPGYRERLQVRPGVTGLAQVQLPADSDLNSVRRKLAFDLYYVENASLSLDLRLILCTALNTMGLPFALTGRLLFIPSGEQIERAYESAVVRRGIVPELQPA